MYWGGLILVINNPHYIPKKEVGTYRNFQQNNKKESLNRSSLVRVGLVVRVV